ncbi:MAG: hypothetical protein H7Z74_09535 [Anaerolineae bacterium]|nr:hypothetical protein [Gemmatimonadaceae bacterium]
MPAAQISALLDALSEYGPEAGIWAPETVEAPVALGCRPFRVTREDAWYRPPIHSSDGQLVLVADARIDNRMELASTLGISVGEGSELSDAAFILAAYQAWEQDCPRHLLGDFAFVLWDNRRRSLFCARDGVGQRVLFYQSSRQRVTLATSAHAVAALADARPRLNEQKVADFLVLPQSTESTFFEGVFRLPPGHTLTASGQELRIQRFWSPNVKRSITFRSDQEYVEGFLEIFGEAISARMRCDGPVGIMVSGGLDSSSVAAVAAARMREQGDRLRAYHAAPRAGSEGAVWGGADRVADESADVEAIARMHPNIDLRIHRTGRTSFDGIETLFRMTGSPALNPSNAGWYHDIYAAAKTEGVRVMLTGHKGNATISYTGLRSLAESARRGHWFHVWREVQALGLATGKGRRYILRNEVLTPLNAVLAGWFQPFMGTPRSSLWEPTASAIKPEFARTMQVEERMRSARLDQVRTHRLGELALRTAALMRAPDASDIFNGLRPWFGIETRDPTSDRRVVEYCFAIPGSQYLRNGVGRWLIRRAMAGKLPEQVRNRTSIGAQSSDWNEWLPTMRGELQSELDRLDRSEIASRCLDLAKLRSLMDRWPERLGLQHTRDYHKLLLRGVMMGRFIRWFEETYS